MRSELYAAKVRATAKSVRESQAPEARAARPPKLSARVSRPQSGEQALLMEESMDRMQAAPEAARTMAYSAAPGPVRLRAGAEVTMAAAAALTGLQLVAPLPPGLESEHAEVRLIEATGRRELRERSGARAAAEVKLRVPAGWLVPGLYNVAIHDIRAGATDAPLSVFRLRVAHE